MIGRLWKGKTTAENADAYETLLRMKVLPGIRRIAGYRGVYLLRRTVDDGVEFVTLTLWESMDAVREFAGENAGKAVVPPEAQRLLSRFDTTTVHYEAVIKPD